MLRNRYVHAVSHQKAVFNTHPSLTHLRATRNRRLCCTMIRASQLLVGAALWSCNQTTQIFRVGCAIFHVKTGAFRVAVPYLAADNATSSTTQHAHAYAYAEGGCRPGYAEGS